MTRYNSFIWFFVFIKDDKYVCVSVTYNTVTTPL